MSIEQIHRIIELQLQQKGPYQIANDVKIVRKYMAQEDFPPQVPVAQTKPSKLKSVQTND
ncbi:hypothetical protein ACFPYJ_02630 [Paenibacillus solisilvae]|uniref:Uncharacterized protein n=1 Tax=Paenibacillus solisilvae TaxID=2486751 RepID=A0ABW0VQ73_9BACL